MATSADTTVQPSTSHGPQLVRGLSLLDSQLDTLELTDEVAVVVGDGEPETVARAVGEAAPRLQAPG